MSFNNILITLVIALCLTQYSEAIKCYKCSSTTRGCGDKDFNPDSAQVVDCSTARRIGSQILDQQLMPTKCMKSVRQDSAGEVITRDCQWLSIPGVSNSCNIGQGFAQEKRCEICESDLCNSASKQFVTFGFITLLVGIVMKIFN